MRRRIAATLASLLASAVLTGAADARRMSFLDNGIVRVGVDLDKGGAITFVSRAAGTDMDNLVNEADLGRLVQQSYYAGPNGLGTPCPGFGTGWNPITGGDCHGHPSAVVATSNDGTTLYVKTIPLQWAFDGIPCECTFEHWITLEGKAVRVRNKLNNNRADHTLYRARDQELPAVYTIGRLPLLVTYTGERPYTGEATAQVTTGPDGARWTATEHWAAHVDGSGKGLGVVNNDTTMFIGGFFGSPGTGGSFDNQTGYISPIRQELLDWNIGYAYDYALVLGTIDEIRVYAAAHRPPVGPDWHFETSREGFWYVNASDFGQPITGALRVALDQIDPQVWSPPTFWRADEVPTVFVRMAISGTAATEAELFWAVGAGDFTGAQRAGFAVKPDGKFHTYRVQLAGRPEYAGAVTRFRLDPIVTGTAPGALAAIDSIATTAIAQPLTVAIEGRGTVRSEPAGIACPPTCSAQFPDGSTVTLEAAPEVDQALAEWSGACVGDDPHCDATVDGATSVGARFVAAVHSRKLTLAISRGIAKGRLSASDGFADCVQAESVLVERKVGAWRRVGAAQTSEAGVFRLAVKGHGVFRARIPETRVGAHRCLAAVSPPRRG